MATPPLPLCALVALFVAVSSQAQVVISEIHYHPVERPRFDTSGNPIFGDTNAASNLSDDVHEFVELHNTGAATVDVGGWELKSGVEFTVPVGTSIPGGGYLVVAKNPARLMTVYGLPAARVVGPFAGLLSNGGDTVRIEDAGGNTVDSVSYEPNFPWPISADALGAEDEFTGFNSLNYQYKGRSLQRVSATASSNDPANWVAVRPAAGAVTFADLPTPGAVNIIARTVPKPAVVGYSVAQATDDARIIRAGTAVKIACNLSSVAPLPAVQVRWFVENMNAFGEARNTVVMTHAGNGQFTATLPGQIDRTLVRYRIEADFGDGMETVAPRADDPAVVQVGPPTYTGSPAVRNPAPREAWHAYFVTPATRTSLKPIYDVFVPTDGSLIDNNATTNTVQFNGINGLQALAYNCKGNPKRTTAQNVNGSPRETPYVPATDRIWNDVVPGVFVHDGVVRDIQIRLHGSRYNRNPTRKSFKVFFPDYLPFRDGAGNLVTQIFETDKGDDFMTGHGLHQHAGLPISTVRYVDWYMNDDADFTTTGVQPFITRLEQGEYNGELLDAYHEKMQRLSPDSLLEATGEFYKSAGFIVPTNTDGEGPYGAGREWRMPAAGIWSELQRFDYTYALQNHHWKGAKPVKDLINGLWDARGDTHTAPNANIANMRAYLQANWDVDTELTALALGNWMTPWDDAAQNHFLWRRAHGKWSRLLWDFDGMYGTREGNNATTTIYIGENGMANNSRGPSWAKDSFLKAFRAEFHQRLWFLNNTLLDPENLDTLTYLQSNGTARTYRSYIDALSSNALFTSNRFNSVNTQVNQGQANLGLPALGIFYKPRRPTRVAPANAAAVLPGASFTASPYVRDGAFAHAAPPSAAPHTQSKWEIRSASSTYDFPVFVLTSSTALTSLPIPFHELIFGQTYFWRVTYFDSDGHPSITSAESSFSYGPTSTTPGNIVLNEIMAENRGAAANGATFPDYIELKNKTAAPLDIGGWTLTDDELEPAKFIFPGGTSVPANGYLTVWCDSETTAPGLHAGFKLDRDGQRVLLIQSGTVRDLVAFGPQAADLSIGRIADGTGVWALTNATPGAANTAKALGSTAGLKVNEWMANPASGDDWFELHNSDANPVALGGLYLSDTAGAGATNTKIPPLSFIAGKGFAEFAADDSTAGFAHCNFKLANGGESLFLTDTNGTTTIDSITFGAQTLNVSQGRLVDGSGTILTFPQSASPGESNYQLTAVVINEALTNSTPPFEDAIEIFNPTATDVDISHWWLSDNPDQPKKHQLGPGVVVPAGGFRVFYENQFPGFSLSSFGEKIVLSSADAAGTLTGQKAQVSFGAALENVSFGRIVTAGGRSEFWPMLARTFGQDSPANVAQFRLGAGASNSGPRIGPVIVNEVMYHPVDLGGLDNERDEFIELHNVTTSAVAIGGWRVKGDSDLTFPAGAIIAPGDYILVVGFDPTDADTLAAFRAVYGLSTGVAIYGPFAPKLANSAQEIELGYPGTPELGVTPSILVDKVAYEDRAPWAAQPDGNGPSLQRTSRTVIGNDAGNWLGVAPTPGTVNSGQQPILDSDGDGMSDAWEIANGFNHQSASDALLDTDSDGQNNRAEFLAGTDPRSQGDSFTADVAPAAGGGFKIRFRARANKTYSVQYRANLATGAWTNLRNVSAQAADYDAEVTDPTPDPQRFYRVITPQQ